MLARKRRPTRITSPDAEPVSPVANRVGPRLRQAERNSSASSPRADLGSACAFEPAIAIWSAKRRLSSRITRDVDVFPPPCRSGSSTLLERRRTCHRGAAGPRPTPDLIAIAAFYRQLTVSAGLASAACERFTWPSLLVGRPQSPHALRCGPPPWIEAAHLAAYDATVAAYRQRCGGQHQVETTGLVTHPVRRSRHVQPLSRGPRALAIRSGRTAPYGHYLTVSPQSHSSAPCDRVTLLTLRLTASVC